jgi:Ketopantoate reductase PanE/ApbA
MAQAPPRLRVLSGPYCPYTPRFNLWLPALYYIAANTIPRITDLVLPSLAGKHPVSAGSRTSCAQQLSVMAVIAVVPSLGPNPPCQLATRSLSLHKTPPHSRPPCNCNPCLPFLILFSFLPRKLSSIIMFGSRRSTMGLQRRTNWCVASVGGNAVSAFLSSRLQATNACDVTLVWKAGFDTVAQYGISIRCVGSRPSDRLTPPDPKRWATNGSSHTQVGPDSILRRRC